MAESHILELLAIGIWAVKMGTGQKEELLVTKWRTPMLNSEPHPQCQHFLLSLRLWIPRLQQQKGSLPTELPFCTTDNRLLCNQKDLALSRREIGCFTQTNVTSQEPPDSFIQLIAAGWKNNCMSNCCVVDLVRCKQKNMVLVMSVLFFAAQSRGEQFTTLRDSLLSVLLLLEPIGGA